MEIFGMLLFITGGACLDSEGAAWYVAAGISLLGLIITYFSSKKNT